MGTARRGTARRAANLAQSRNCVTHLPNGLSPARPVGTTVPAAKYGIFGVSSTRGNINRTAAILDHTHKFSTSPQDHIPTAIPRAHRPFLQLRRWSPPRPGTSHLSSRGHLAAPRYTRSTVVQSARGSHATRPRSARIKIPEQSTCSVKIPARPAATAFSPSASACIHDAGGAWRGCTALPCPALTSIFGSWDTSPRWHY